MTKEVRPPGREDDACHRLGSACRRLRSGGVAVVFTLMSVAILVAACGGSPTSGVASLSTTSTTAPHAPTSTAKSTAGSLGLYVSCMRAHHVTDFPDPDSLSSSSAIRAAKRLINQVTTNEGSSPRFQAAQRACARYAPVSAPPRHVSTEEMERLLAVSRCMRAHGVLNFPDPNPTTGQLSTPAGIDRSSPTVLAALRACASLGRAAGLGPPNTGE